MEIIKDILSDRIKRKLSNGLTEVKEFHRNGRLMCHYFIDENGWQDIAKWNYEINGQLKRLCGFHNGLLHGEYKDYSFLGVLLEHKLFKNGELVKDYLK